VDTGLLVDPAVCRAKFEQELEYYKSRLDEFVARGGWLVKVEYPDMLFVFGTPHLQPPGVAFGALIDFTNYDLWPPSLKIINPFTQQPYKASQLPTPFLRRVSGAVVQPANQDAVQQEVQLSVGPMAQAYSPEDIPFICLVGLREYHNHLRHSGDLWLLHRRSGRGKLSHILEVLIRYGVQPMGYNFQLTFQIGHEGQLNFQMRLQQQTVPE
jgi:hypothetical protein